MLWFDVESRYMTTHHEYESEIDKLWFDVESRYMTTYQCLQFDS